MLKYVGEASYLGYIKQGLLRRFTTESHVVGDTTIYTKQ